MPTNKRVIVAGRAIEPGTGHAAGRALLAEMFRELTGEELPPIRVTDRGKPYFPDSPVHFSITHTRRHVFCALAECPVGIDAEELDRDISLSLAEKILSPGEMARYRSAPDRRLALLRLWVLKEAQAKCTGRGLTGYPNHTDFSPEDPRITVREGCLLAVITKEDIYAV